MKQWNTPNKKKNICDYVIVRNAVVLLMVFTVVLAINGKASAATMSLGSMVFQSTEDVLVIVGETTNIKLLLYDQSGAAFNGSVSAYTVDAYSRVNYYSVTGSNGSYSVNNVVVDTPGTYYLYLHDSSNNYASGAITAYKPLLTISGEAAKFKKSVISGYLYNTSGIALSRKTITIDASDAGIDSTLSCTTSYTGYYSFSITPTKEGTIRFLYADYEIGTLAVGASYTQDARIGGSAGSNLELAICVAEAGWTSASTVILTRDDSMADALTAVPLSKLYDAPILMNPTSQLDSRISTEISALGATKVLIIGGYGAISQNIETALQGAGYTVERISGGDRYATSAKIAAKFSSADTVYIASGQGESDALAASSFAAKRGCPILLTDKDKIPAVTQVQLSRLDPAKVLLLGGEGVIGSSLETTLKKSYVVERLGGSDRYATEWAILRNLFTDESHSYFCSALTSSKDVSSGKPRGDALLAAALAAKKGAIIVAVPQKYLPTSLQYFLTYNRGYIASASIVGNSSAVSTSLEKQIKDLMTL